MACDCLLQGDFHQMKANYDTRYLSEVLYNLRLLKLVDATCFNRKRLFSVFQFLARASNKDKLKTC